MSAVPAGRHAFAPSLSEHARRRASRLSTSHADTRRLGQGLSDRALAWLFVGPTILLLLAFNIFPLLWTIWLSFTNFRANRPNADVLWVGIGNYSRVLNDEAIWENMRATAHFLGCSITLQLLLGFGLALLLNRRFRTHSFWSTAILLPMMLAPAVVGTFWKYFFEPQYGIFNYIVNFFGGPGTFTMLGDTAALALGHRAGRHLDVDALRDAAAAGRPALDPALPVRGRRDRPRLANGPSSGASRCRW